MSWLRKRPNATKGMPVSRIGARPEINGPPRASRLLRDLEEGDGDERAVAATALRGIRDLEAIEALVRRLSVEGYPAARDSIVETLKAAPDLAADQLLFTLRECMEEGWGSGSYLTNVMEALGELGEQRAVPLLTQCLDPRDPSYSARIESIIGRIRESEVVTDALASSASELEADARREQLRAALPAIHEKYLHTDVTALGERVGPGGQQFMDATEEYERGNWESACRLMKEAVSLELTMPFESAAHRALGVLYIKLGDLQQSVEHFLKCLEVPVRDEGALRDSIDVLSVIYRIAGSEDDVESLRVLAEQTIRERSTVEPGFEEQVVELTREFVARART